METGSNLVVTRLLKEHLLREALGAIMGVHPDLGQPKGDGQMPAIPGSDAMISRVLANAWI